MHWDEPIKFGFHLPHVIAAHSSTLIDDSLYVTAFTLRAPLPTELPISHDNDANELQFEMRLVRMDLGV